MRLTVSSLSSMRPAVEMGVALSDDASLVEFHTLASARPLVRETLSHLGARWRRRASRLNFDGIDPHVVRHHWPLLLMRLRQEVGSSRAREEAWWQLCRGFDRRVSERLRPDTRGVIGFENICQTTFRVAKARDIATIYIASAAHPDFSNRLTQVELERFPDSASRDYRTLVDPPRAELAREEITMADLIIAHSQFTKRSFMESGIGSERIAVVSLGCPTVVEPSPALGDSFLFVASEPIKKGVFYLLEAWKKLASSSMRLILVGGDPRERLPKELMANVDCRGTLDASSLAALYRSARALVLPSVSDGFGMVVGEALAHGVPVITTPNVGASDLIREGENGWIVPVANSYALADAMSTVAAMGNDALTRIRRNAIDTALTYSWSRFRNEFIRVLSNRKIF